MWTWVLVVLGGFGLAVAIWTFFESRFLWALLASFLAETVNVFYLGLIWDSVRAEEVFGTLHFWAWILYLVIVVLSAGMFIRALLRIHADIDERELMIKRLLIRESDLNGQITELKETIKSLSANDN